MDTRFRIGDSGLIWLESAALELPAADQVKRTEEWLKINAEKRKSINRMISSYGLKHQIEKDTGYITNGALIQAANNLGYQIYPCRYGDLNCWFNISLKKSSKHSA
jgi:hypothetical protein